MSEPVRVSDIFVWGGGSALAARSESLGLAQRWEAALAQPASLIGVFVPSN
jgi:hypothetical protein